MSKLKHTPGPWAWQEGDRYIRIRDEESEKVGYWNESQKIAETYYVNNDEETISNNLIIAAAPEMLEVLINSIKESPMLDGAIGYLISVKNNEQLNPKLRRKIDIIERATGLKIEEVLNEN